MQKSYQLRSALSDLFDWSAYNVRDSVDKKTWSKIRSHFSELKGILDEHHAGGHGGRFSPDDVLNTLDEG